MRVGHQLSGYSRVTDLLEEQHDIPPGKTLELARGLIGMPPSDPLVECFRLDNAAAWAIARQLGVRIDTYAREYFLEGYAK